MTIIICNKCDKPICHPQLRSIWMFGNGFCHCRPERLNPEEAKPMGFKFAKKAAIIGTENPQVFDLCDSLNTTNK